MSNQITEDGKEYIAVEEKYDNSCTFYGDSTELCGKYGGNCTDEETIWLPQVFKVEESKYTLDEVLDALNPYYNAPEMVEGIVREQLRRSKDPQYIEYQRLKAVYENPITK